MHNNKAEDLQETFTRVVSMIFKFAVSSLLNRMSSSSLSLSKHTSTQVLSVSGLSCCCAFFPDLFIQREAREIFKKWKWKQSVHRWITIFSETISILEYCVLIFCTRWSSDGGNFSFFTPFISYRSQWIPMRFQLRRR